MSTSPGQLKFSLMFWIWIGLLSPVWLNGQKHQKFEFEPPGTQMEGRKHLVTVWKFLQVLDHGEGTNSISVLPRYRCGEDSLLVLFSVLWHSDLHLDDGSQADGCNGSVHTFQSWRLLKVPYTGCNPQLWVNPVKVRYFDGELQDNVTATAACENPRATPEELPVVTCGATNVTVKHPHEVRLKRVKTLHEDDRVLVLNKDTLVVKTSNMVSIIELVNLDSAGEMSIIRAACLNMKSESGQNLTKRALEEQQLWELENLNIDLYDADPTESTITGENYDTVKDGAQGHRHDDEDNPRQHPVCSRRHSGRRCPAKLSDLPADDIRKHQMCSRQPGAWSGRQHACTAQQPSSLSLSSHSQDSSLENIYVDDMSQCSSSRPLCSKQPGYDAGRNVACVAQQMEPTGSETSAAGDLPSDCPVKHSACAGQHPRDPTVSRLCAATSSVFEPQTVVLTDLPSKHSSCAAQLLKPTEQSDIPRRNQACTTLDESRSSSACAVQQVKMPQLSRSPEDAPPRSFHPESFTADDMSAGHPTTTLVCSPQHGASAERGPVCAKRQDLLTDHPSEHQVCPTRRSSCGRCSACSQKIVSTPVAEPASGEDSAEDDSIHYLFSPQSGDKAGRNLACAAQQRRPDDITSQVCISPGGSRRHSACAGHHSDSPTSPRSIRGNTDGLPSDQSTDHVSTSQPGRHPACAMQQPDLPSEHSSNQHFCPTQHEGSKRRRTCGPQHLDIKLSSLPVDAFIGEESAEDDLPLLHPRHDQCSPQPGGHAGRLEACAVETLRQDDLPSHDHTKHQTCSERQDSSTRRSRCATQQPTAV